MPRIWASITGLPLRGDAIAEIRAVSEPPLVTPWRAFASPASVMPLAESLFHFDTGVQGWEPWKDVA